MPVLQRVRQWTNQMIFCRCERVGRCPRFLHIVGTIFDWAVDDDLQSGILFSYLDVVKYEEFYVILFTRPAVRFRDVLQQWL